MRITDLDRKAKDIEQKRSQLYFQYEKERANWLVDEEQYKRRQSELEEIIASLERQKESLRKENDRLSRPRDSSNNAMPRFTLNTTLQSKYSKLPDNYGSHNSSTQGQGHPQGSIVNAAFTKYKDLK